MQSHVSVSDTRHAFDQNCRCYNDVMSQLKKQNKTHTLVRGFKNRRIEVRVEPTEREFRATTPHEEE